MRLAKAATGSRNYKMGMSKAPTRGKVNPTGYVQREIRNRQQKQAGRGNDGRSDRRSGLAKAALNNVTRYGSQPKMAQKPVRNMPGLPSWKQPKVSQGRDIRVGIPEKNFGQDNDFKVGIPGGEMGSQRPIPNLQIGQNGQLDLPFDEAFGLGLVDQQQAMNSELLDLQGEQQAQAMEFANNKRDLGLQFEDVKRNTLNGNAAGGTAFSSQYAVGASKNAQNYNNAINDLDAWNTQAMSGFANQRAGIQNAFNDYIRQAVLRQSMDLAEQAGDLGYGQDAPNSDWWGDTEKKYPSKAPHNKSKPKSARKKSSSKKKLPTKPAKKQAAPKKAAPKRLKKR